MGVAQSGQGFVIALTVTLRQCLDCANFPLEHWICLLPPAPAMGLKSGEEARRRPTADLHVLCPANWRGFFLTRCAIHNAPQKRTPSI
jgi:hypothetical protein